jgi:hypothetical protein
MLPARGYQGHDALLNFYEIFQKIPTTVSRLIARAKGFWRKLNLAKNKDDDLHGMMGCHSFKAPSPYAPTATA